MSIFAADRSVSANFSEKEVTRAASKQPLLNRRMVFAFSTLKQSKSQLSSGS